MTVGTIQLATVRADARASPCTHSQTGFGAHAEPHMAPSMLVCPRVRPVCGQAQVCLQVQALGCTCTHGHAAMRASARTHAWVLQLRTGSCCLASSASACGVASAMHRDGARAPYPPRACIWPLANAHAPALVRPVPSTPRHAAILCPCARTLPFHAYAPALRHSACASRRVNAPPCRHTPAPTRLRLVVPCQRPRTSHCVNAGAHAPM